MGKESYEDVHTKKFSFSLNCKNMKKIRVRVNNYCIQHMQFRGTTSVQEAQISSAGMWSEIQLEEGEVIVGVFGRNYSARFNCLNQLGFIVGRVV